MASIYDFEMECMEDMDYRAELGFMGADDPYAGQELDDEPDDIYEPDDQDW
jgi:hypothetical protein